MSRESEGEVMTALVGGGGARRSLGGVCVQVGEGCADGAEREPHHGGRNGKGASNLVKGGRHTKSEQREPRDGEREGERVEALPPPWEEHLPDGRRGDGRGADVGDGEVDRRRQREAEDEAHAAEA
jgi:hypothetical protein